jgi:hypothetical protein
MFYIRLHMNFSWSPRMIPRAAGMPLTSEPSLSPIRP